MADRGTRAFREATIRLILRSLWTFIGTFALYFGLALVGWGLSDIPGYFASPARLAYAVIVALFGIAVAWQAVVAPEGIEGSPGLQEKRVPRQAAVGLLMLLTLAAGLVLLPMCDRRDWASLPGWEPMRWLGVALAALGYALVFLSGVFLGRQYSAEVTIQEHHTLITAGPYRFLRHPRYMGILLITLGAPLTFGTWAGFALFPFALALLLWRIRDEEALMAREFGKEWKEYSRRTARLVPWLY